METLKLIAYGFLGMYLIGVSQETSGPLAGMCFIIYVLISILKKEENHHGWNKKGRTDGSSDEQTTLRD